MYTEFDSNKRAYAMEDDDDYQPDSSGCLELKYRGLTDLALEPRIWSFTHCLISLDLSFNQLQTLPPEICNLQLLQEINCACNKLQTLPASLFSMDWLAVIKANGNCLSTLPSEIGQCKSLQTLNLSENVLTSLPNEIAGCTSVRTILLQNNDLPRLPLSLATLGIQQMDISNNNTELKTTMPTEIHRDVSSIMFILSLQQEKRHRIHRLKVDIKGLQHDNIAIDQELARARERIAKLEVKKRTLEADMDSVAYFFVVRSHCRELRRRLLKWWQATKLAWSLSREPTF